MGNKSTKGNKEFQSVIPYTPSSNPKRRKKTQRSPRRPTVAPALLVKENSGGVVIDEEQLNSNEDDKRKRVPLRTPSLCEDIGWTPQSDNFDFNNTEGQNRRELIASCEDECSLITSYLFVGGAKVANSKEKLKEHNITRVVNCSLFVVDNVFESDDDFMYLGLNVLDGRQDDLSWFLCEIINFIEICRRDKKKVLLHCERGISRSCSFAIAYVMWAAGCGWKVAFDYVKERRQCCSPNTGFTCNLIEIDDLLRGDSRQGPLMFRLAQHLPHDQDTPVLKIIRNADSRNIIRPHFGYLCPEGIFVIRPSAGYNRKLYIWKGQQADERVLPIACNLAEMMLGIFSDAESVEVVLDGAECDQFKNNVQANTTQVVIEYDDLFGTSSDEEKIEKPKLRTANSISATQWFENENTSKDSQITSHFKVDENLRGGFLHGIEQFEKDPSTVLSETPFSQSEERVSKLDFKFSPTKVMPSNEKDMEGSTTIPKFQIAHSDSNDYAPSLSTKLETSTVEVRESITSDKVTGLRIPELAPSSNEVSLKLPSKTDESNIVSTEGNSNESGIKVVKAVSNIPRTKPALFMCTDSTEGSLLWQHMGVYDDDDLTDDALLFLLCPNAPHHLWKGSNFAMENLSTDNSKELSNNNNNERCIENHSAESNASIGDMSKTRQFVLEKVEVGEVPLSSENLHNILSSTELVQIHRESEESEMWWEEFNKGM